MLSREDIGPIADLLAREAPPREVQAAAHAVRMRLNPHPAGQLALNIPAVDDEPLPGVQHKYPETVLIFPKQGQTCHAYCTYCFRWAQFVDEPDLKMATDDMASVVGYLRAHPEVTSVLITGGDPMIMGAVVLRRYVEPLLNSGLDHIESIRIGTKSLAYWPQRFVTDPDADDTLRLFEEVAATGRNLALMAHFSHPRELEPPLVAEAVSRIRSAGARDPHPGAADQDHQRRSRHLGHDVAHPAADGDGAVLHVRGARHRPAGLLRGPAGPRRRDLPGRLQQRVRACAGPSAGRPCRRRPARSALTGSPRSRARRSSCCT